MRTEHEEFTLPTNDQTAAIRHALECLHPADRIAIMAQIDAIMGNIQARRGGTITGMGIGAAMELLAKLGVWMNDNPGTAQSLPWRKYDPDDLKPEERR